MADAGSGPGFGYTINLPVPRGTGEEVWLSLVEHVIAPIGLEFMPQLVLISAGFDAHERDPLGECVLETESFAQIARHIRDLALAVDAPIGAVLEGGYDPEALAASVVATLERWPVTATPSRSLRIRSSRPGSRRTWRIAGRC